jgi:high affinity choline transporter 7
VFYFPGGTFFATKMRDAKYVTMIDPFTQKYGKWGALQALPAAMSEIFWSASILGALGEFVPVRLLHLLSAFLYNLKET